MDQEEAFQKINDLLEDTDYPVKIRDIGDIDDFLLDDGNRRFEQYAVIGRIYDDLRQKPEIDRYTDVSISKTGEETKRPSP